VTPILVGIETEYGLLLEGRGAEDQVDDATELVRDYPGPCFVGWDYRYETPRSDLRGFRLESLAFDPEDAKFDEGKSRGPAPDVRADRVLPNGARFYNDHGHPEYSTPECNSIFELAKHDCAGQIVLLLAAQKLEGRLGRRVQVFKNNTDFHGASYGTHENYLAPRPLGYEGAFKALLPMLIARQVLTGAGKVGSESGQHANYQLSQRADFFAEPANAETLFRRPIFNTRDEPHADPSRWMRLHVISGDANMIPACTARKAGLVKLALRLAVEGDCPEWRIADPVRAFQQVSRDESYQFKIELAAGSWTTAGQILESYFAAAEGTMELDDEARWVIETSRQLLIDLYCDPKAFRREVDWAAKRFILEQAIEEEGLSWNSPDLRAYDLEYHNPDPEEGLHAALCVMGEVAPDPPEAELLQCLERVSEPTRARARSIAVRKFRDDLETLSWGSIVFRQQDRLIEVGLAPNGCYPAQLEEISDVGNFIAALREIE
jgi:hypothetical protein